MSSVNITIRVEEETKRQFDAFCESVGMNVATAIHLYIKAVLRTREIPFVISDIASQDKKTDFIIELAREALLGMQKSAAESGLSEMTMDEIDEEIAAYRREKRG